MIFFTRSLGCSMLIASSRRLAGNVGNFVPRNAAL